MIEISSYINQANEELEAATLLLENNYYRACISRCYYAIYCMVQALLIVKNINTRNHRGVRMKLSKQLQILVKEAPEHGISKTVMEKAVNPVLMVFAKTLKHPKYYIMTNAEGQWLVTTLSHREKPQQEKKVLYAFSNPQDAVDFHKATTSPLKTSAMPVTHLLFQLFALKPVDSIIFMAESGNLDRGIEVSRRELEDILEKQLRQLNPNKSIIT